MDIALVVLNWNGVSLLKQFLPSLVKNSSEANIYVVDNNSTDDSIDYIEKEHPEINIIKHSKNYGFAGGYNKALSQIKADVFGIINSDIEVTPNWLQYIIQFYNTHKEASILQPKILDYNRKDYFEYAGAAGGFIDKYGYAYCRGRVFESIEKDNNQYDNSSIFWASGACMFIKSEDFKHLKGFDSDFFAHYEEIDLCWRAQNEGISVNFVAKSKVYHVGGGTLNKQSPFKTYLNFRNSLYTLIKNLPRKKLFLIIFIRMVLDGVAGIRFLFRGEITHIWSIIKAHISFYKNLRLFLNKRNEKTIKNYYQTKSIVFNHFLKMKM